MRAFGLIIASGSVLAACATAPVDAPPLTPPSAWQAGAAVAANTPDAYWTVATTDATFQSLMAKAGDTPDVAIAEARLREAEALLRAARGALFPTVSATGAITGSGADRGLGVTTTQAAVSIAGPLDIFGATRDRAGAAAARAAAADAESALARLQTRRSAGQLYAALRTAQASRAAAERQTRDAEESLALARVRAQAGLETGLAVAQAQAAADAARARIPAFAQAETQARLGLEALLGEQPGAFITLLAPATATTISTDRLLEAPASVLARRPDVRAAEARLRAAGLDASAARADRWPTATLGATLSQTSATRGLDGAAASGGLALAATLFDFGRLDALADAAGARAQGEAAAYRRTVLLALSDVEREANRLDQAGREASAARDAVASAREQTTLARARYTSGLSSFIDVLLAERAFADAEIALAGADGRAMDAGAALAAALGLGQDR